jgi:hypothetical protein
MSELGGRCPGCGRMRTWVLDGVTVCLFCEQSGHLEERGMSDQKGTCCVCGKPAPDSVVCDDCFLTNVVRPTVAYMTRERSGE